MKPSLFLVEIAGPAGAGKSTLAETLAAHSQKTRLAAHPSVRDARNLLFFLMSTIPVLPVFLALDARVVGQPLTRRQHVVMAILKGWPRRLREANFPRGSIVLLDQGPVYMLSDLLRFGPSDLRQVASTWWNRTCQEWGDLLDLVVCLDGSDAVLLERVRRREKPHGFKRDTDLQATDFLNRCRQTQNATLSSMSANSTGPKLACFDTSGASPVHLAEEILDLIQRYLEG